MIGNLVGSIYERSSIEVAHSVPIHYQTWPPQAILVSDWLILKILLLFWPCGFRGEEFLKSANQKQELPVVAMFDNGSGQNEQPL
jgi:hypothetical protein